MCVSVFETELEHLLDLDQHGDQCIVVCRTFGDVEGNIDDMGADDFLDLVSTKPARINREVENRRIKLRDKVLPQKVHIFRFK